MTYRQPSLFPHLADKPIKTPRTPRTTRRALRNVSQHQFMPITQLANATSGDYEHEDLHSEVPGVVKGQRVTVGDVANKVYTDRSNDPSYHWNKLTQDVATAGIKNPLLVRKGENGEPDKLLEGHHRAAVAMAQGHMFVPVKHEMSGDDHDESYRRSLLWD